MLVIYDLRDAAQWTAAGEERRAWGRERTEIYTLTNDVIVIEFRADGALEVRGGDSSYGTGFKRGQQVLH
jgi:hypothetical protein